MKILKQIIFTIVTIILVLLLTYNVYNFVSIKILKKDIATVFGYAILEVVSGSMEPTIHVGDMIVIDTYDEMYEKDDIVTFYDKEGSFTTHRIIDIDGEEMTTKGDNNNTKDTEAITKEKIVGKYIFKIGGAGIILAAFKSPLTMALILIIGVLICVLVSTDKEGNPILTEEEKEYEEFLKYQNTKAISENVEQAEEKPKKKSSQNTKKKTASKGKTSKTSSKAKITIKEENESPKKTAKKDAKVTVKTVKDTSQPKKKSTSSKKKTEAKAKVTVKTVESKKKDEKVDTSTKPKVAKSNTEKKSVTKSKKTSPKKK